MTQAEPAKAAVYHVVNPNDSSHWEVILSGLKKAGVEFDIVSRAEWLDRVARSELDYVRNPMIKLLASASLSMLLT